MTEASLPVLNSSEREPGPSNLDLYRAAQAKIREAQAEAKRIGQLAFREGADALFLKFPDLLSFGWRQYTPYFNDGDPCTFGVDWERPEVNGEDYEGSKPYTYTAYSGPEIGKKITTEDTRTPEGEAVKEFLRSFSEELFEQLFGDHVRVRITMGMEPEIIDYSHD